MTAARNSGTHAAEPKERPLTQHFRADGRPLTLKEYVAKGGYSALRAALAGMAPLEVIQVLTDSGLAGRGWAGFPA